jgi:two-component system, response regulator PdtaR
MRRFNGSPKNQHPGGASSGTNQIWVALYFVTHQPPSSSDRPIVVLVVEDEALVRMMAADFFDESGLVVLEADDAKSALQILQREANRLHVLFTDVQMPGSIDGLMLARHTRRVWPWIHLIVTSGLVTWGAGELPDNTQFFPKPYELQLIDSHIRHLMM